MTEQERRYMTLRGWIPTENAAWWRRADGLNVMHWRMALTQQMDIDEAEAIDAMLRLPALMEAVNELIANSSPCGEGYDHHKCVDPMDLRALAKLVTL